MISHHMLHPGITSKVKEPFKSVFVLLHGMWVQAGSSGIALKGQPCTAELNVRIDCVPVRFVPCHLVTSTVLRSETSWC